SGRRDATPAATDAAQPEAEDAPVIASDTEEVSAAPAPAIPENDTASDEAVPAAAPTVEETAVTPDEPATPARRRVRAPDLPPIYSPVIPTPDPGRYAYETERRLPGWAMALLGLVVLLGIGGGLAWWLTRGEEPDRTPVAQRTTPAPARPDSARAPQPAVPVTLPDTLRLVMQATGGALRGVRVTIDEDVRRPYWLEQGEQRTFAFRDSITVHEPPAEATLTVQGQPVPATARRPDGNVVVRRADLAAGR
ncbi:MAG TPA: hypothetical protein VD948_00630, partial [Rhodothermales bacterium]|nr:hypothetical protein [Rhodothermales bacterium]